MNLSEILFPVYRLTKDKPSLDGGILFYGRDRVSETEVGEIVITPTFQVVDDITIQGATLAARRLRLKALGIPLFKLSRAVFFLGDFIKISAPNMWFIDSEGKIFTHVKTTRANLVCQKLLQVIRIPSGGAIVETETLQRYKMLFIPADTAKYAGILITGKSQILYGVYDEPFDDTWRMI
jgi:hypothetical protein